MQRYKIYTKTGDRGETSLLGGSRVSKSTLRVHAYGTTDELNSNIGLCYTYLLNFKNTYGRKEIELNKMINIMSFVQNKMFILGSIIATDKNGQEYIKNLEIKNVDFKIIEDYIKEISRSHENEDITKFNNILISQILYTDSICLRAISKLSKLNEKDSYIKFLSLISSLLVSIACYIHLLLNGDTIKVQKSNF